MIKKFKYMVKGIKNPIAELVDFAIDYSKYEDKKRGHSYVTSKTCNVTELDDFINRANAAWEAVCLFVDSMEPGGITLEISSFVQQIRGDYDKIWPYIQVKFGKSFYRISLPTVYSETENYNLTNRFGKYYVRNDIRDIVTEWLCGNYTVNTALLNKEDTEVTMNATQETDLFVVLDKGEVWSVDTGALVRQANKTSICDWKRGWMFRYARERVNGQVLNVVLNGESERGLEIEVSETYRGSLSCICNVVGNRVLCRGLYELEKLYRDGRSNLPDAVFDKLLKVSKFDGDEEKFHEYIDKKFGKLPPRTTHTNSAGVCSDKWSGGTILAEKYPAETKILSQDKIRDADKLNNVVREWASPCVVSWKLDGCAVRLHYRGSKFVRAESKGKARDVSGLMKLVDGWPETISHGRPMVEDWFADREWFVTGELVARDDRRSVAAGFLLRKDVDSEQTYKIASKLDFIVYDSNICEFNSESKYVSPINLYSQMLNLLQEGGFRVVRLREFKDAHDFADWDSAEDIPSNYDVDGLVVRINDIDKYALMGETNHHPKGSIAFKFEDVWYRVKPDVIVGKKGDNNVRKFIARFKPITINGKQVSSAVYQPIDDGGWKYEIPPYKDLRYGLQEYQIFRGKVPLEEAVDCKEIEVCLRGCVIPQWRFITK